MEVKVEEEEKVNEDNQTTDPQSLEEMPPALHLVKLPTKCL